MMELEEKLEELEKQDVSKEVGEEFENQNQKQNQRGGAGMKATRRKRNIEGMLERLKRLQKAIKESQKMYYVEQGRAVLSWYQEYKQNRAGVRELEEQLKAVAEMFGKSLDEPVE
jgi:imidazolonepropionase-like amidohydrolase